MNEQEIRAIVRDELSRVSGGTPGAVVEKSDAAPTSPVPPHTDLCECGYVRAMHIDSRRGADLLGACEAFRPAQDSGDAASAKAASSTPEPGRVASPTPHVPVAQLEEHRGSNAKCAGSSPAGDTTSAAWTEEQRKTAHWLCHSTAFKLLHDHPLDYSHEHDTRLCEEIARIAPLFAPPKPAPSVEAREIDVLFDGPPGPEAGRFVEVEDAATGNSISFGDWIPPTLDGYWRLRFKVPAAPTSKTPPSVEDCVKAFEQARGLVVVASPRMRSGIAAVRALCIENKGDGASVPGDSGPKAGHNMERVSGCPASDHHADRETSTPQGPKDPAPSPTFTPDRDALADRMARTNAKFSCEFADVALAYYTPLIAERDALRKEKDTTERQFLSYIEKIDEALAEWKGDSATVFDQIRRSVRARNELLACEEDRRVVTNERDALRARIAELERKPSSNAKRVLTKDELRTACLAYAKAYGTDELHAIDPRVLPALLGRMTDALRALDIDVEGA